MTVSEDMHQLHLKLSKMAGMSCTASYTSCAKFYQCLCFKGKSKLSNILAEWNNASVKKMFNCHFPTNTSREKPLPRFLGKT